jgi:hypothetical protein
MKIRSFVFTPGMPVVCTFSGGEKIVGKFHTDSGNLGFICHDDPTRDGTCGESKHGHRFSWAFRYNEETDVLSEDIVSIEPMIGSVKEEIKISPSLLEFVRLAPMPYSLHTIFAAKVKPFENFAEYDLADKPGFITLKGSVKTENGVFEKKVEVKISRFVKTVSDKLCESTGIPHWAIKDQTIEEVNNLLVAHQSGGMFTLEVLSGNDILEGYTGKNYSKSGRSTLHKSCMTDKLGFLKLYTENQCVKLAVLRSPLGIEARCLLWDTEDGFIHDRVYYSQDWISEVMSTKLQKMGYKSILGEEGCVKVNLDHSDMEEYPFVDNFYFMNGNALYFTDEHSKLPRGRYKYLRNTSGGSGQICFD